MKGNYQLNTSEILKNGSIDPEEVEESLIFEAESVEDVRPTVTSEEYVKLSGLKSQQTQLKERGFDLSEFVSSGQAQVDAAKVQFSEVKETLSSTTQEFQDLFNEVTGRYGFTGNVTIEDSEPHYIYETSAP